MIIMFVFPTPIDSDFHTWQDDGSGGAEQITPGNLHPSIFNYQQSGNYPNKAVAFGKASVIAMLSQENCVGMRCYFAESIDDNGDTFLDLVLVGVSVDSTSTPSVLKDIITVPQPDGSAPELGLICDCSFPCPPTCDTTSPLYAPTE